MRFLNISKRGTLKELFEMVKYRKVEVECHNWDCSSNDGGDCMQTTIVVGDNQQCLKYKRLEVNLRSGDES